jgi:hypothetical protein
MFAPGKADRSLFVTSNRCIPDKRTMGWCVVVFCVCEIIQSSAVSYVVIIVHKFDFIVVAYEKTSCKRAMRDRAACFWQHLYVFLPTVVESVTGLYPRWAGQLHSLETATSSLTVIVKKPMGLGMWNFIQRWAVNITNYARNFTLQIQMCQYAKLYQYWCMSHFRSCNVQC